MKRLIVLLVIGVCHLGFSQELPLAAEKQLELHDSLSKALNFYDLRVLKGYEWAKAIKRGETLEMDLLGQIVEAKLESHSLRAKDFRVVMVMDDGQEFEVDRPVPTYRGHLVGIPDSEVRLVINEKMISGTVNMEGEVFHFQPASKFLAKVGNGITVIYRDTDVLEEAKAFCGMKYHKTASENLYEKSFLVSPATPKVVQIALDTDGEFVQNHPGQDISDLLEGFINQLDAIWRADLDLQLEITAIFVRPNPNRDPWNSTPYGHGPTRYGPLGGGDNCLQPGNGVFEQFRNFWNASPSNPLRDIMVLFVGRDMKLCPTASDPVIHELFGSAGFLGTICRFPDRAYVIQEEYPINTPGLLAHEIGHSLNGEHRFTADCNPGPPIGPVLCGTVEAGSDFYSAHNINRIGNYLAANNGCLGEEFSFTSVADAYVLPWWPNNNYGSRKEIFIRTSPQWPSDGYIKFNVQGLTGAVSSAKLRIKTGPGDIPTVKLYTVSHNSWNEFTITWNNRPPFVFDAGTFGPFPPDSWVELDVTSFVSGNGVVTIGITSLDDLPDVWILSRQHPTDKPQLIVRTHN